MIGIGVTQEEAGRIGCREKREEMMMMTTYDTPHTDHYAVSGQTPSKQPLVLAIHDLTFFPF